MHWYVEQQLPLHHVHCLQPLTSCPAADRQITQPAGQGGAEPAGTSDGEHEGGAQGGGGLQDQPVPFRPGGGGGVSAALCSFHSGTSALMSRNKAFILVTGELPGEPSLRLE